MTMSQITPEKDSKKPTAEDVEAGINNATQQNKTNTKTAVDPKITITVKNPRKAKINEKARAFRIFIYTIMVLTVIGAGLLIYLHINFFCTDIVDVDSKCCALQQKYLKLKKSFEDLQAEHAELMSQHDLLVRRTAVCMTNFISSVPSLKKEYGEKQVLSMMNQFGEAIQEADESID